MRPDTESVLGRHAAMPKPTRKSAAVHGSFYSFVLFRDSARQLLNVTTEVMGIEDRFDVLEAVPGEGRDLRHGGLSERQAHHGSPSQIMKREAADASRVLVLDHDVPFSRTDADLLLMEVRG
jgi:hypothetical protein